MMKLWLNLNKKVLFEVAKTERKHKIWQRGPLSVLMNTRQKVDQKITIGHLSTIMRQR